MSSEATIVNSLRYICFQDFSMHIYIFIDIHLFCFISRVILHKLFYVGLVLNGVAQTSTCYDICLMPINSFIV